MTANVILPYSVHLADLEKVLRRRGIEVSLRDAQPQARLDDVNNSGRPRKYKWDDMEADLLLRIDGEGAFASQAEAEKWAGDWFHKFGKGPEDKRVPVESEIRKHVRQLLDRREAQIKRLPKG